LFVHVVVVFQVPHADVLGVIDRCLNFDPRARPTFKDIEASLSAIMTECVAVLKNSKHSKRSSVAGSRRKGEAKAGAEDGAVEDEMKEFTSPWSDG
jgi:hypothetical protein